MRQLKIHKTNESLKFMTPLRLLSTGLDFLNSAAGHLRGRPKPEELKYAILHLCAGTELILKERLLREHWSLVFDDLRSARRSAFETGDFKSVAFNDSITRLTNVVGLTITTTDQEALDRLRKKRNQMEHFGIVDSSEALVSVAAEALNFLIDFISAQFPHDGLTTEDRYLISEITNRLAGFKLFVQKRWTQVEKKLANVTGTVVWCSSCGHYSAIIQTGTRCLFCGAMQEAEEAATDHIVSTLLHGESGEQLMDSFPLYKCASCQLHSLVDCTSDTSRAYRYICFSCSRTWSGVTLRECSLCEGLFAGESASENLCNLCASQD